MDQRFQKQDDELKDSFNQLNALYLQVLDISQFILN